MKAERGEQGFTLIEVLMAALLLVVGILTTLQALDSSRRLTLVAERQTSVAHRAQVELERVKSLPYSQIGLTGASASWGNGGPYTTVTNQSGACPGSSNGAAPQYQPDHRAGGSSTTEPLVIDGCTYTINGTTAAYATGNVVPVSSWSDGRFSGSVYDFVTWTSDPTCSQTSTPGSNCPISNDYKRITVVVTLTGAAHPSNPAVVSTFIADPSLNSSQNLFKSPSTSCTNGSQTVACSVTAPGTPDPVFLCDSSYSGSCGSGGSDTPSCTGNNLTQTLVGALGLFPAPDAASGALPTASCTDSGGNPTPPCYGLDLGVTGCQGLPILPNGSSCGTGPPTTDNKHAHAWVAPVIPQGSSLNLTGSGAMTTYLESPSGASVSGTLCLHLYVVPNTGLGILNNLLTTPIGATVSANFNASAGVPTPVTFNFSFGNATTVSANLGAVRILIVVWVAASASTVEMVYDQAQFASEVTLMTQ